MWFVLLISQSLGIAPRPAVAAPPAQELQAAIATRQEFGLRADPAYVAAASLDLSFDKTYGLPLSPAEKTDLDRRSRVQAGLEPLVAFLNLDQNVDLFGGIYVDQLREGEVVVSLTSASATAEATIRQLAPSEAKLSIRIVPNSLVTSRALLATVDGDLQLLQSRGIQVTSTWYSSRKDSVFIGVHKLDSASAEFIADRYHGAVRTIEEAPFEPVACMSRTNCGSPIKGGLNVNPTGGGGCTSAFNARTSGGVFAEYVVTAGHCVSPFLGVNWYHHGVFLGTGYNHAWHQDSHADVGIITDTEPLARNQVFASGISDIRGMTSAASDGSQLEGNTVYRSAWASNAYTIGTITKANYSPVVGPYRFLRQWEWSKGSVGGDSGSTMMFDFKLYGILAGTNGVRSNYGTVDGLFYELVVRPCLNTACS